ncbi:MAG: chorismate mutase [Terracidiphilus sp.]|jgi:isochorismate pyruvate lyase
MRDTKISASACDSIEEIRSQIDRIDCQIVALIAERGAYVSRAAYFKKDDAAVRAPGRVEDVIRKVRALAEEAGANPALVESVYRAMIAACIDIESAEHAKLTS